MVLVSFGSASAVVRIIRGKVRRRRRRVFPFRVWLLVKNVRSKLALVILVQTRIVSFHSVNLRVCVYRGDMNELEPEVEERDVSRSNPYVSGVVRHGGSLRRKSKKPIWNGRMNR